MGGEEGGNGGGGGGGGKGKKRNPMMQCDYRAIMGFTPHARPRALPAGGPPPLVASLTFTSSQEVTYHSGMLREISVQNLALIEDVRVELHAGFCAWTGETGAGSRYSSALGATPGRTR